MDPEKVVRADRSPSWHARLEALTSELFIARGPGEVAEAALSAGLAALGAESGAVLLQGGVGGGLEVLRVAGVTEALLSRSTAGLSHTPVRQAWRTGTAVFLERPEAVKEEYPQFAAATMELPGGAIAALPLSAAGRLLGMLVLGFGRAHLFREEEREFALSLARQVAQALERAQLFVSAQAARAEALSARSRLSFLESVSRVLTEKGDERTLCTRVVDLAVPTLCDWAAVFAKEEGGPPFLLATSGGGALGD